MKFADAATTIFLNSLDSNTTIISVETFTITLANGQIYRFTSSDVDITIGSILYTSKTIKRGKISNQTGFSASNLDISFFDNGSQSLIGNFTIAQAANAKLFDGAEIEVRRLYMPNFTDANALSTIWLFNGRVGNITASASCVTFTVDDDRILLNIQMPRNVYMPSCLNTLADSSCGVNLRGINGLFTTSGSLTVETNLTYEIFSLGYINFTSGANIGLSASIKLQRGYQLTFASPLESPVQIGDSFVIYAGCDKQMSTCSNTFNNINRFRGTPFVPAPYTAY
jgi:uncharacterized phage protein (TIGR02218 family)